MDSLELERLIQDQLRRIHAAKLAGQLPLGDCLREVVHVAAKLLGSDENRVHQASQVAWKVAVEYGWAMTIIERSTVRMMLATHAAEWTKEALSGEAETPVGDARRLELLHDDDGRLPQYVSLHKARRYARITTRRMEQLVAGDEPKLRAMGGKSHRRVRVDDLIKYYPPEK
jgi:hypothetical protein